MHWKVFLAAATGRHHRDEGTPCQDAGRYAVAGETLVAAVCDGAGSAAQGHAGARLVADTVVDLVLQDCAAGTLAVQDAVACRAALLDAVGRARAKLAGTAQARGLQLREFACTLVGCLSTPAGGCFFHIGDGYAVHEDGGGGTPLLSRPENGEFADETYFLTDPDWEAHLRFTPLPGIGPGGLVGLLSDGAAPFAIDRPRTGFYRPFLDPVVRYLRGSGEPEGSAALLAVLDDEKTCAITSDDKTLLLALAG